MQNILFFNHDRTPGLRNKKDLKKFIAEMMKREGTDPGRIVYVFCSDKYLLDINRRFLKHNYYTDVIGFDLSETPEKTDAEIYISLDRVKANAKQAHVSVNEELHRVIFHGALHFCGYQDKSEKNRINMRKSEDKYIKKYFNINMFHVKHTGRKHLK